MSGIIDDKKYQDTVCKLGHGHDCCRYLGCSKNGMECLKNTELQGHLDMRVATKTMVARGDNCAGWEERKGHGKEEKTAGSSIHV